MSGTYAYHLRETLRLALPASLAQLGMMLMSVVDTAMVGRLGAAPLAAVALGSSLFYAPFVLAMGIVNALDPMVSQSFGARQLPRCGAILRSGVRVAIWLSLPLVLVVVAISYALEPLGVNAEVARGAAAYMRVLAFGAPVMLATTALSNFLHGLGHTRPTLVAVVVANVANVGLNWVLIYGNLGMPALGELGSGVATVACRLSMLVVLAWLVYGGRRFDDFAVRHTAEERRARGVSVDWAGVREMWRVGAPISGHLVSEVGMFSVVALMMGWLGARDVASHQVALQLAACAFMVTMGLGTAGSIRVGHASGAGDRRGAATAAWVAVGGAACIMSVSALAFLLVPEQLAAIFTTDAAVQHGAARLLRIAAFFQLADGVQGVIAGCLRGAGDTGFPMRVHALTSFVIALPLGAVLAFGLGFGAAGLWWGLTAGLCAAAALLLWRLRSGRWWGPLASVTQTSTV